MNISRIASLAISLILMLSMGLSPAAKAEPSNLVSNRIKIKKHSELEAAKGDESEEYSAEKMEALASKRRALILDIKKFIRESRDSDQKAELESAARNALYGGLPRVTGEGAAILRKKRPASRRTKAKASGPRSSTARML